MTRKPKIKLSRDDRAEQVRAKAKAAATKAAEKAANARATDFDAVGLAGDASRLAANDSVVIERAGTIRKTPEGIQTRQADGARRQDAFDALRDGMPTGAYDAARRLERDMRERRGENDRGRDQSGIVARGSERGRTDAMLEAGDRVKEVLKHIGDRDGWLLSELIYPANGRTWRESVYVVTGETHTHAQGAAVRSACENLRHAYARIDLAPKTTRRTVNAVELA